VRIYRWLHEKKRVELFHEESRYIVAFEGDEPLAFILLRFELDEERPILYVYELQLSSSIQRIGLGTRMLQTTEVLARCLGLVGVMLTVQKKNRVALSFYRRLGYQHDCSSPDVVLSGRDGAYDYFVLSKLQLKPATGTRTSARRMKLRGSVSPKRAKLCDDSEALKRPGRTEVTYY
jgi:ribosomal protein S18 acetylase RimI-like enzyme